MQKIKAKKCCLTHVPTHARFFASALGLLNVDMISINETFELIRLLADCSANSCDW
jgi:hypothetical protein